MATAPTPAAASNSDEARQLATAHVPVTAKATPHSATPPGPAVVDLVGVTKRFGTTAAMDGLDLQVTAGEVHGFLGPNGSGKTTTLRVLLGLLRHDSGSVRLLGGDPWAQAPELHRRLAYVPGDVNLWPNLTGGEMIDLLGNLRGGLDPARRAALVERFDLDLRKKGRAYSKGNRQKIALIAALAADVELYLFDEPTSGLDPLMEEEFRACVREIRERGGTVLLSSHILSEVESLADRVTIVRAGRVVETGTMADLRHLTRTIVTAVVTVPPDGQLAGPGVFDLAVDGTRVSASVGAEALGPFLTRLTELGVQSLTSAPPTLEELFLRHYREA